MARVCLLLALGALAWAEAADGRRKLHIGVLFPMTGDWAGGVACKPAAMMALDDINNETSILPGYKLQLHSRDSRCSPGLGVKRMYELLYNPPIKSMFLTGCSTVTTFVAQAAKMWNLIVLAYGSSSPALSNRQRFPTFFRTHPSASIQNPTRIKLLKLLGWRKIAVLWQMEEVFTSTFHDLDRSAELANISIAVRQSFQKDPSIAIKTLKKADARIIVGLFYEKMARRVFCEAYRQGLYGRKYVWIIIGWYANNWYLQEAGSDAGMNCSSAEMLEVVEGHITTESVMWNDPKVITRSGMTSKTFRSRLKQRLAEERFRSGEADTVDAASIDEGKITGFQEAPLAYDAVWALALALDKAERRLRARNSNLTRFDYTRRDEVYEEVYRAMNETHFIGVSTAVYFDSSGNRIAWTKIEQMINGRYHTLGHYHYIDDNLTMVAEPVWKDSRKPRDQQDIVRRRRSVSLGLYAGLCGLAACTLLLALACLAFNVRWRDHPAIRSSQPLINSLLCVGCCVALMGVFLYGVDRLEGAHAWRVDAGTFHLLCHLKLWVLSLGFTLGYGALFSKTWTVYRLATHQKKETAARIGRWEVYVLLSVLLLIDVLIMAVWQVVDPLYRVERQFAREVDPNDEDIVYQPYSETCSARHGNVWLGLNFGWKGLLLMFGLLLAYETRNVKLVSVSDSRLAGMAVYNVVVLCCITAPVSLIIDHQQNALFAFIAVALCLCAGLSLGLLFVPKFAAVARHPHRGYGAADGGTTLGEKNGPGGAGAGSKEEEERHQRLVTENDMLKHQIDECESKIQRLHQGLHDRSKARVELTRRQFGGSGRAARGSLPNSAGAAAGGTAGSDLGKDERSQSPSCPSGAGSQVGQLPQTPLTISVTAAAGEKGDATGGARKAMLAPRLLSVRGPGGGVKDDTLLLETTTSGVFSEMPTHTTNLPTTAAVAADGLSLSETYL